jgi:membrane-bound metal-dependent hydrolase YbcI (DUF457 family)
MPFPLGHTAIGLATYELNSEKSALSRWKIFVFVMILANLPDVDVLFGLLLRWNGSAFHRGPTHSLVFAVVLGLLASRAAKMSTAIPAVNFWTCFCLILSHVAADALLTDTAVSFFWPFELNWSPGQSGWTDVFRSVLLGNAQDVWIILGAAAVIGIHRVVRSRTRDKPLTQKNRPGVRA